MARKRPTRQASRRQSHSVLPWVWLLTSLAVVLFIILLIWLSDQGNSKQPEQTGTKNIQTPITTTPTADSSTNNAAINNPVNNTEERQEEYGFYTDLPNAEVIAPVDEYRLKKPPVHVQEQKPSFSNGKYSLQAGAFRQKKKADEHRATLGLQGYESSIKKTKLNGQTLYRVILGPYPTLEETNKIKTRLHAKKITTFLVKDD